MFKRFCCFFLHLGRSLRSLVLANSLDLICNVYFLPSSQFPNHILIVNQYPILFFKHAAIEWITVSNSHWLWQRVFITYHETEHAKYRINGLSLISFITLIKALSNYQFCLSTSQSLSKTRWWKTSHSDVCHQVIKLPLREACNLIHHCNNEPEMNSSI